MGEVIWFHKRAGWLGPNDEKAALQIMTTAEVKALWDRYDGTNEPDGISGEAIHTELNRRGEGVYCAV